MMGHNDDLGISGNPQDSPKSWSCTKLYVSNIKKSCFYMNIVMLFTFTICMAAWPISAQEPCGNFDKVSHPEQTVNVENYSWFEELQIDSVQFANFMHLHHAYFGKDSMFLQVKVSDWIPDSCGFALASMLDCIDKVKSRKIKFLQIKRIFENDKTRMRHKIYKGQYGILRRQNVVFEETPMIINIIQGYDLRPQESAVLDLLEFKNYLTNAFSKDYVLPEVGLRIEIAGGKKLETISVILKL